MLVFALLIQTTCGQLLDKCPLIYSIFSSVWPSSMSPASANSYFKWCNFSQLWYMAGVSIVVGKKTAVYK